MIHWPPDGPCTGDRQCLACAHWECAQIHRCSCSRPTGQAAMFLWMNAGKSSHNSPFKKNTISNNDSSTWLWTMASSNSKLELGYWLYSIKFSWLLSDKIRLKYRKQPWNQVLRSSQREYFFNGSDIHLPTGICNTFCVFTPTDKSNPM